MDHTQIGNRLLWETVQRQLITEILQDYSYYVDRNDPQGLVTQVFCEDGEARLAVRRETYEDMLGRDVLAGG